MIINFEDLGKVWEFLDDSGKIEGLRRVLGVKITEGSTDIRMERLSFSPPNKVGEIEKLVPENRFADGWPTYVKITQSFYEWPYGITWKEGGQRMAMKVYI